MVYSKTCEHAIRALIYFADHPELRSATVKDISKESGVSAAYIAKIFQCLVKSGILSSRRGSAGGYALLIPPAELNLLKIVQSLDDLSKSLFSNCIMGFSKCDDIHPCPLHPIWSEAKEKILETLQSFTIADMAALGNRFKNTKQRRYVLSEKMRNIFSLAAV